MMHAMEEIMLEHSEDGKLVIVWNGTDDMPKIYSSSSPDFQPVNDILIHPTFENNRFYIEEQSFSARSYYHIQLEDGRVMTITERLVTLKGVFNFRDFGGYPTKDGRRVKWGRLFRSSKLDLLTMEDMKGLQEMGVKLICDLRSQSEIILQPTPAIQGVKNVNLPIGDPENIHRAMEKNNRLNDSTLGVGYRMFANSTESLSKMFHMLIEQEHTPAVFHCAAGKDRTGVTVALILLSLNVPMEIIMKDYMITNAFTHDISNISAGLEKAATSIKDPQMLQAMMEARPEYLMTAIDEIEKQYGSLDLFFEEGLHFDLLKRRKLQDLLLTE
jgi:protein-tyrosine phosphatase